MVTAKDVLEAREQGRREALSEVLSAIEAEPRAGLTGEYFKRLVRKLLEKSGGGDAK